MGILCIIRCEYEANIKRRSIRTRLYGTKWQRTCMLWNIIGIILYSIYKWLYTNETVFVHFCRPNPRGLGWLKLSDYINATINQLYDPTPAGWDDWNIALQHNGNSRIMTQPPRVGMIETTYGAINPIFFRPSPRGLGWLKHRVCTGYKRYTGLNPYGLGWLKLFYCIPKILNFLTQPLRVGMIETVYYWISNNLLLTQPPVGWGDWNASILLYKECSINDQPPRAWMIETGSHPSIHIFSYHAPAPCRRDDWNMEVGVVCPDSHRPSPPRVGMIETDIHTAQKPLYGNDPTPTGWDDWNDC